jgi:hypothetical protein
VRYLLIHYLDETAELSQADDSDAEGSAAARELRDWVTEMETSGADPAPDRHRQLHAQARLRGATGKLGPPGHALTAARVRPDAGDVRACGLAVSVERVFLA